jgi:hypothetical protein
MRTAAQIKGIFVHAKWEIGWRLGQYSLNSFYFLKGNGFLTMSK